MKAGVLHVDLHDGNIFVQHGSNSPHSQLVLGDWGSCEKRPEQNAVDPTIRMWFEDAHVVLVSHVVERIQGYILRGLPRVGNSRKEHINHLIQNGHSQLMPFTALLQGMNEIERALPAQFVDGDEWLSHIINIYNHMERYRVTHLKDTECTLHHVNIRPSSRHLLPSFEAALQDMERLHASIPHEVELTDLWLIGELDPLNRIVSLYRPRTFSGQYEDDTQQIELPEAWRRTHGMTRKLVKDLLPEDSHEEFYQTAL